MSDYPKEKVPESCCESEKNKNLKTIDDALNSGALNENDVFEFDSATVEIIYGAAERMAEEIEKAYITVRLNVEDKERAAMKIEQLEYEITQLKAEIERRPEVVFCKDCRAMQKGDQIDPERLTCVHGAIVEPYDFCSMGQRGESEEGK